MALFFGYDPGGYADGGSNGVVSVQVNENGRPTLLNGATLRNATDVFDWFKKQQERGARATAVGIDTLLAWSDAGQRGLDDELRSKYKGSKVQQQNSLFSAMTINGILVAAKAFEELGLRLVESHPKLLITAGGGALCRGGGKSKGPILKAKAGKLLEKLKGGQGVVEQYNALLRLGDDHQADAFIAAWCASRWHAKPRRWSTDLYAGSSDLVFPTLSLAGCGALCRTSKLRDPDWLAYPWPEKLGSSGG